ncbi:MAG: CocE/NonD family hydrolase, partial [Acidimicrobiales bacterium]
MSAQSAWSAMQEIDGARCFSAMVPMRDGVRLNTFVYLPTGPAAAGKRFPVIVHRTPYGITNEPPGGDVVNPAKGWLPDPAAPMRGAIKHGWQVIVARGYAAVYQDCRGRYASEGEDHVYGDDALDGFDLLEWIATEAWSDGNVGLSGSSAGSTTALAAASQNHPSVKALFAQVGGSSIYDDVVYEGGSIEMERLWLWVANNIPGLSHTHRDAVARRSGRSPEELAQHAANATARFKALDGARHQRPPYLNTEEWMHLPLLGYPDFSVWQPFLDELISHPAPDAFRAAHNFRANINVPGFHVTTWFDIFLTSVLAAFTEIQARVGNQKLWIGPNDHYFVYERQYWARDPYFEWFDHWLKGVDTPIVAEPAVFYSPRCWVTDTAGYEPNDWR